MHCASRKTSAGSPDPDPDPEPEPDRRPAWPPSRSVRATRLWNFRKTRWSCATIAFSSLRGSPISARPWTLRGRSSAAKPAPNWARLSPTSSSAPRGPVVWPPQVRGRVEGEVVVQELPEVRVAGRQVRVVEGAVFPAVRLPHARGQLVDELLRHLVRLEAGEHLPEPRPRPRPCEPGDRVPRHHGAVVLGGPRGRCAGQLAAGAFGSGCSGGLKSQASVTRTSHAAL